MSVLISGHGEFPEQVQAARRAARYRTLVLLTPNPQAPDIAEMVELEGLAKATVRARKVEPRDLLGCLRAAVDEIARTKAEETRVHVGGGSNLLTSALLLASFQTGTQAFLCHARGTTPLPVANAVGIAEQFSEPERLVLHRLRGKSKMNVDDLADARLGVSGVRTVLYRLRKRGLVTADPHYATLTATGLYYRQHLERMFDNL